MYGRCRLAAVVLGWIAINSVGCADQLSPQAKQLLQSGCSAYNQGDDEAVIRQMDAFLRDNDSSSHSGKAYYLRGLAKYRLKDLDGAKADLREALARTDSEDVRAKASLTLGELAYEADDMAMAEHMYRMAQSNIEQGKAPSDHAHYRLGCVLQRQGRWADADIEFGRVTYFFNGSELAKRAGRRTHCTSWTIQAGAFRRKGSATAAAAKLVSKNTLAVSRGVLYDGKPMFVVQVGRYPTYEQAIAELDKVKSKTGDAFVTVTR
ncbi:MAG: SPOR domain-containing protein [Planctomycetota bacterium]|nr:SPOR domain-containing protein [Planctomycetota bacterium]